MEYPGGKGGDGVYQTIINQIPPHHTYIEAFAGGGAVLRMKRPAAVSIAIDADAAALQALSTVTTGIPNLQLVHGSALDFLRSFPWRGTELVYCDPPYLMAVRSSRRPYYRHEFHTLREHAELLRLLVTLPTRVMISGYWHPLYGRYLQGWRSLTYQATTHATHRTGKTATEWLWMNYPEPAQLHDYAHAGRNYRKREDLKRKIARWTKKLVAMDPIERQALLTALLEVSSRTGEDAGAGFRAGPGQVDLPVGTSAPAHPPRPAATGEATEGGFRAS